MADRGAPKGNDNAGEGRRWREAIRRALARSQGNIDRGLDRLADRVISAAAAGSAWAIEHVAERMDGKSIQHVQGSVEHRITVADDPDLNSAIDRALGKTPRPSVQ